MTQGLFYLAVVVHLDITHVLKVETKLTCLSSSKGWLTKCPHWKLLNSREKKKSRKVQLSPFVATAVNFKLFKSKKVYFHLFFFKY